MIYLIILIEVGLIFSAPYDKIAFNAARKIVLQEVEDIPKEKLVDTLVNLTSRTRCERDNQILHQGGLESEKDHFKKASFAEMGITIIENFVKHAQEYINSKKGFFDPFKGPNEAILAFLQNTPSDPTVLKFRKTFFKKWSAKYIDNLCLRTYQKFKGISISMKTQIRNDVSEFVNLCESHLTQDEEKLMC